MAKLATIAGYRIEADHEGFGLKYVHVSKGKFWASIAELEDGGVLHDDMFEHEIPVPAAVIEKITAWADANGF